MESEVPFTKRDLLAVLSGHPQKPTYSYFIHALAGTLRDVATFSGLEVTQHDMKNVFLKTRPTSFFFVPKYFYDAWVSATEMGDNLFHGMRIEFWEREFIVARYNQDAVIAELKAMGCKLLDVG